MSKKILLVDDAKIFLEVEKTLFKRTGAQILTASSGTQALKSVIAEKPDVVLLDFMMPDITGDKVCAQIKSNPETADIPVIMVTTMGRVEDVDRCRRAGCDDFATKPIHHQELLAKVAHLLKIPHRLSMRIMVRVEAEMATDGKVFFGTSIDLSTTGMLIEAEKPLKVGDEVTVRFFLPRENEITGHGKIMRVESTELRKFRYGILFHDLPQPAQQAIARYVESRRT